MIDVAPVGCRAVALNGPLLTEDTTVSRFGACGILHAATESLTRVGTTGAAWLRFCCIGLASSVGEIVDSGSANCRCDGVGNAVVVDVVASRCVLANECGPSPAGSITESRYGVDEPLWARQAKDT